MSELNVAGMAISPNVVETIVAMAARDVEGVESLVTDVQGGIRGLLSGGKQSAKAIEVDVDENDQLHIALRMNVKSGYVLPDVAADVRRAVADAVAMQMGIEVGSVDIFIDGIHFSK